MTKSARRKAAATDLKRPEGLYEAFVDEILTKRRCNGETSGCAERNYALKKGAAGDE